MNKYPSFPFDPKRFLKDPRVRKMTDQEVGFYVKMLCHEWVEGGIPLSSPPVREWWSKGGTVAECFEEKDGKLKSPWLEEEREKKRAWSEKSSKGGAVAAEIKKLNAAVKGGTRDRVPPLKDRPKEHKQVSILYKGSLRKTVELFDQVAQAWNTMAEKRELAPVLGILPGTQRAKSLLELFTLPGFDYQAFFNKISSQGFLMGESRHGWRVSFDWAIKLDNYMKIMENQYENIGRQDEDAPAPKASWDRFADSKKDEEPDPFAC